MKNAIMATGILCAFLSVKLYAATAEIWPAERRRNNTAYLIGNEQNFLLFNISNRTNLGTHKLQLPENFDKPVSLVLDIPVQLKFLGAKIFWDRKFCDDIKHETVKHDSTLYNRYTIPLNREQNIAFKLKTRIIKNQYNYYVTFWVKPPAEFTGKVFWNLKYGDESLAKAAVNARTVGVIEPKSVLPKRFKFNVSAGLLYVVPNDDYQRFYDLCKRLGINSASVNYGGPLSEKRKQAYTALRKAGIKNIANRGGSFGQYQYGGFRAEKTMAAGGLEAAAAVNAENINSNKERELFRSVAPYFDGFNYDYEPAGPKVWPGLEDKNTIAAFAKKLGLKKIPSQKELQGKYRKAYAEYRMELLSRSVFALKKMIDAVKPMDLAVEQGDGVNSHIDYKFYDKAVRWHGPMIYTTSPINYYQRVLAMARNLDPKKVMPVNSAGWTTAGATRQSPQDMVMDTVCTAATGCGGISHWPGLQWIDPGVFYGFYKGLKIVAQGEDFYFDGKVVDDFKVTGIPFKSKKINLGFRMLDLSQPDWKNYLFSHQHKLNNETLITLLNFNQEHDAFVKISGKLTGNFLVNPVDKTYLAVNSNSIMVKVPEFSPGLWIVTKSSKRLTGCKKVNQASIENSFAAAKKAYLADSGKATLQLGSKGRITIGYGLTTFGGKSSAALNVKTPLQIVSFSKSGGRIVSWKVGKKQFVYGKNFSSDGFCMDLLWLPSGSRWSGDQVSDMRLTKCVNDGSKATIVFAGEFKKGFPNLRIVKTFTIPADKPVADVNVQLINGTPEAITVAYWSHNALAGEGYSFISGKAKYSSVGNSIFVAPNLSAAAKSFVCMPTSVKGISGTEYQEVNSKEGKSITMKLPANFLNVYRWSKAGKDVCGSEWMTQPILIPAGSAIDISFSIKVGSL